MSSLPPTLVAGPFGQTAMFLVLGHDDARYRRHCDDLRPLFESTSNPVEKIGLVECFALTPDSIVAPDSLVRIAQQGLEGYLAIPVPSAHAHARFVLATAHIRAGSLAQGELLLKELESQEQDGLKRARYAAWLAVALLHEHRRDEAKTWFKKADRFLRVRLASGRTELEEPPPDEVNFWNWCRLMIAWREAQALLLDEAVPADPFAHD